MRLGVYIGRFQPFHIGHERIVAQMLAECEKVIVFVGSSNFQRNVHNNPFSFYERNHMITQSFWYHNDKNKLTVEALPDILYNNTAWASQVQSIVSKALLKTLPGNTENVTIHGTNELDVYLYGHDKDSSTFYLKMFPDWKFVEVGNHLGINATNIRDAYFCTPGTTEVWEDLTPIPVRLWMYQFKERGPDYATMVAENQYNKTEEKKYSGPHKVQFQASDAIVIQGAYILLIERGKIPGNGRWALPGGYLEPDLTFLQNTIKELREETGLKVPERVLLGSIKKHDIFDHPKRDGRGRMTTVCYYFHLEPNEPTDLPKVKGGDDARKAFWLPVSQIDQNELRFFMDHRHIIKALTGL